VPTRPKKGSTPKQNTTGSSKRGGQKAVVGSGRTPGAVPEKELAEPDEQEETPAPPDDAPPLSPTRQHP